jgi:hypothetical protein
VDAAKKQETSTEISFISRVLRDRREPSFNGRNSPHHHKPNRNGRHHNNEIQPGVFVLLGGPSLSCFRRRNKKRMNEDDDVGKWKERDESGAQTNRKKTGQSEEWPQPVLLSASAQTVEAACCR